MQPDSIQIATDTVLAPKVEEVVITQSPDTSTQVVKKEIVKPAKKVIALKNTAKTKRVEKKEAIQADSIKKEPINVIHESDLKPINLYSLSKGSDSATVQVSAPLELFSYTERKTEDLAAKKRNSHRIFEKEWVFGLTIFALILFIVIRLYYQKHLSTIITSLVNMQLSEKLLREKGILVRRVFFLLNMIYILAMSLYLYTLASNNNFQPWVNNAFTFYVVIFATLTGLLLLRLGAAKLIALVFDSVPVIREYNHNAFIVNKNLGLYLLPVLISTYYIHGTLSHYLFIFATILVLISLLIRYVKAIQIILKHNIFLFYSILYLCTLEILPVLIGIKFVLTQR